MKPHYYNVAVNWNADCKSVMCLLELNANAGTHIEVATTPEFPKGIPGIWSPEPLLTTAASSCFMTAFLSIAENLKLELKNFSCKAKGKLE